MSTPVYIARYPAYDIVEPPESYHGAVTIKADEPLAIYRNENYTGRYAQAYANSVVSYALSSGCDPIEWLENSKAKGEALHWINLAAISLTAEPQERRTLKGLHVGQWVRFEGRYFTIQPAPNGNFKLVSIDTE